MDVKPLIAIFTNSGVELIRNLQLSVTQITRMCAINHAFRGTMCKQPASTNLYNWSKKIHFLLDDRFRNAI